ncbi:2-hexaprenyl-6-methoxy-1,4-benzoquinone methyltransferase [Friedmanniomyces endolithicus]|nr:2-hexaprenyl-6-methoxy-1,4-benzoquinone methyltransferase [Friedmanniomyces endolithicus]
MAGLLPRATKRLRLSPTPGFVCHDCRRAFTSSIRHSQQQQPAPSQHVSQSEKTTHFGFETVAEELKASRVRTVFSSVAANYDTMNDLMSLGIHRLWKDHFVRSLNPGIRPTSTLQSAAGQTILDIAGGTGDIALRLLDHATTINRDNATSVIISDINPEMLAEGRKRFATSPYYASTTTSPNRRVSFLEANAEDLSAIESNSIDLYTVAFGIRNFTHKEVALKEAFRVLKPGAADRESYQYLVESIERFPSQPEFAGMIEEAGFMVPGKERGDGGELEGGWEDLSLGIAAIHKGVKPV